MTESGFWHPVLGRLGGDALPFWRMLTNPTRENIINDTIGSFAALLVVLGGLAVIWVVTRRGWWRVLWSEWLTSVDHKKIGIMYIVLAFVMLARALVEALLMRSQQAVGLSGGFLSPEHFGQFFSTHGTIMIFFMAMPFLTGLINYVMPLQIGARDVSFPVMNSVSLGLTIAGAVLVMISLVLQPFSTGGWSGYPPFTERSFSPGAGPDYWIWAVTLSSLGTMMTGINFAVTIYKERCEGMHLFRMPLFTWTALCTSILMIFAMPPLTVATALLALDRYLGFHLFTTTMGGNMMNYANLFWLFGHPEVYILILPAFGVYSEVFSTFSGKRLYGYTSLVIATMAISVLSFTVWVHHFFTMGQDAALNAAFGIATMLIGIPTGVKIYDWMLTMVRGRVRITVPMVYAIGFVLLFVVGGTTGIVLANPSVDYQVHNTLFLVAHFHNMLIPGTLFGMLAGYTFWFPKAFGFRLADRWGYVAALCWSLGFMLAFFPLYGLGLLGMPRRMLDFAEPAYLPYTLVALLGACLIVLGFVALCVQLWQSVRDRAALAVPVGDPWDGRSLEWSTSAPPPEWNFARLPVVDDLDPFAARKEAGTAYGPQTAPRRWHDIEMPANSTLGPVLSVASVVLAFGLVWYIWWMVTAGLLVVLGAVIARGFARDTVKLIPAEEVRAEYEAWQARIAATPRIDRGQERTPANRGHAIPAAQEGHP
ncbi:cbb3-type cytochrome c oxidase subunit I [Brevirhabdus sp.]|uniref:cbb3-type cytochrome c oxidase subunit I n=1 Tax=Brevirhabdus sp. TaxID=2004514 RepID=UPI004058ACEB